MKPPASEPTLPGPTQTLQDVLGQVVRRLVFGHYDGRSPLAELPIAQLRCLHVIRCHEGQKMQDLADALAVKLPTLSQIVERLVRRGMVERHPDPMDRRVVRLRLTEAARTAMGAVDAARQARLTAVSDALPPEEHERVIAGLRLLIEAAVRALPDESAARAPSGGDPLVDLMARRNPATAGRRRPALGDAKIGEP